MGTFQSVRERAELSEHLPYPDPFHKSLFQHHHHVHTDHVHGKKMSEDTFQGSMDVHRNRRHQHDFPLIMLLQNDPGSGSFRSCDTALHSSVLCHYFICHFFQGKDNRSKKHRTGPDFRRMHHGLRPWIQHSCHRSQKPHHRIKRWSGICPVLNIQQDRSQKISPHDHHFLYIPVLCHHHSSILQCK